MSVQARTTYNDTHRTVCDSIATILTELNRPTVVRSTVVAYLTQASHTPDSKHLNRAIAHLESKGWVRRNQHHNLEVLDRDGLRGWLARDAGTPEDFARRVTVVAALCHEQMARRPASRTDQAEAQRHDQLVAVQRMMQGASTAPRVRALSKGRAL